MKAYKFIFQIILATSLSGSSFAQFSTDNPTEDEYYNDQFLRFKNYTYQKNIETVMLHPKGWPIAAPFITLGDPESILELHFDVLDSSLANYMYTLIHCDYNWKQSDLDIQEYIDGPPEDYLLDYDYSRNTFQRYIHYKLELPNFNMRITKSGNYLLKVFDSDTKELILTRRFCVTEDRLNVNATVKQATMVKKRYSHQEIDFTISTSGYEITNPYTDLHTIILQNHSWENSLTGLEPRFVKENMLDYDYDGENTMEGLNEFRLFDIKNPRYNGIGVASVSYTDQVNHAYLERDKSRASKAYLQNRDINGWFFIQNDLFGGSGEVDADYVNVHFAFNQEQPLSNGDIYIYGALTDWKLIPEAKMKFNQLELQYENTLYLKQGIYSYIYAFVPDGDMNPNLSRFEGSHFQTENEYSILVYHRRLGMDYDQLLAIKTLNFPARD
ncbi:MAG: DUF5103 domain-containing protein [Salibacteraceae bacterium]